jgi:hypothetical protein
MTNRNQRGRKSIASTGLPPPMPLLLLNWQNSRSRSLTKDRAFKRVHVVSVRDSMQDKNEDVIMGESS